MNERNANGEIPNLNDLNLEELHITKHEVDLLDQWIEYFKSWESKLGFDMRIASIRDKDAILDGFVEPLAGGLISICIFRSNEESDSALIEARFYRNNTSTLDNGGWGYCENLKGVSWETTINTLIRFLNYETECFIPLLGDSSPKKPKSVYNRTDNPIIKLLSKKEELIIEASDGGRSLAQAKDTFKSGINPRFESEGLDQPSPATPDTPVDVWGTIADGTFLQMFCSLSYDLDSLCLTQNQIEKFCLKYNSWLQPDGYDTFFLFRENDDFFVAMVRINSDGLAVKYIGINSWSVWRGSDVGLRVVVRRWK